MSTSRPLSARLRADCANCCGLCCAAPAFDASQGFGFSKPAHQPCTHLAEGFLCRIHSELQARGFPACAMFDCYGAGQWVTQKLFAGRTWRSSPELAARMYGAYGKYRALHELMALLELAIERARPPGSTRLRECLHTIQCLCETGEALAAEVRPLDLRAAVLGEVRAAME